MKMIMKATSTIAYRGRRVAWSDSYHMSNSRRYVRVCRVDDHNTLISSWNDFWASMSWSSLDIISSI